MTNRDLSTDSLAAVWRARAQELERFSLPAAVAFRECAAELEAQQLARADLVTLREASLLGGYSIDHLQRLVAAGTIDQMGRKHAPRIRRADVPIKPGNGAGHGAVSLPNPSGGDQFSARRRIVADAQAHKGA